MLTVNCRLVAPAISAPTPLLVGVDDVPGIGVAVEPEVGVGVGVAELLLPIPPVAKYTPTINITIRRITRSTIRGFRDFFWV